MTTATLAPPEEAQTEAPPEAVSLPMIDGQGADRIEVQFAGGVRLDRSDPADCEVFRRLKLGEEVTIRVVGVVATKVGKVAYDEDGYPGETTHIAKLRITTLYRAVGDGTESRVGEAQLDLEGTEENGD